MELNKDDASELVEQLQHAHRISVAFYRRILPTFDMLASEARCQFRYWEPFITSRPCSRTSQPSRGWAWDFVPLYASKHVYWRTEGPTAQPGDVGISFCLYIDDGFSNEERDRLGIKEQPDPITLPIGSAYVLMYVFRPIAASSKSFSELWDITGDPEVDVGEMRPVGENMQAICIKSDLNDVIRDVKPLVVSLKKYAS